MVVERLTDVRNQRALLVSASSRSLKGIHVTFDDQNLVANAGLLAIATLPGVLESKG